MSYDLAMMALEGLTNSPLDRPDPGDVVQLRPQRPLVTGLAVEADGEAVRLVAHALHELQDR